MGACDFQNFIPFRPKPKPGKRLSDKQIVELVRSGIPVDLREDRGVTSAQLAFLAASDEAAHESGHGGYTGTIAEKSDFVVIATKLGEREAYALADKLMQDNDPRIDDKWGPAGCIEVAEEEAFGRARTLKVPVEIAGFDYTWSLKGKPPETRTKRMQEYAKRAIKENVEIGEAGVPTVRRETDEKITFTVPVKVKSLRKTDKIKGWLFFGWASS